MLDRASFKSCSILACFLFALGGCSVFEASKGDTQLTADAASETRDCRQSGIYARGERDDVLLSHHLAGIMPGAPMGMLQLMRTMVALESHITPVPVKDEIPHAATVADSSIKDDGNKW